MPRAHLSAMGLLACVSLTGCVSTRIEEFYEPSGDGIPAPLYMVPDNPCSGAGPRYMGFDLGQGVKVVYHWDGNALEGNIFVPAGVRVEFPDGVATARSASGDEVQGKILAFGRTVWYGSGKGRDVRSNTESVVRATEPLIGWTEQDVLRSGVLPPGTFVDPKGASGRLLSWNVFKFYVSFDHAPSDAFTVRLPAARVNGQPAASSELHFKHVTKTSWILEPCV